MTQSSSMERMTEGFFLNFWSRPAPMSRAVLFLQLAEQVVQRDDVVVVLHATLQHLHEKDVLALAVCVLAVVARSLGSGNLQSPRWCAWGPRRRTLGGRRERHDGAEAAAIGSGRCVGGASQVVPKWLRRSDAGLCGEICHHTTLLRSPSLTALRKRLLPCLTTKSIV